MISIPEQSFPNSVVRDLRGAPIEKLALCLQIGWHTYHNTKVSQYLAVETGTSPTAAVSATASVIGAQGEDYVENILKASFEVKDVTKRGYAGDFIIHKPPVTIMVEVKNYTQAVPSAEVEKFYRDLRANSSVQGGLFISLNTRITGVEESMKFTHIYENRKVPIIFVKSVDPNVIQAAAELLYSHLQGLKSVREECAHLEQESYAQIYQKVRDISNLLDGLSLTRTHLNETREILLKQLSRLHEDILTSEVRLQDAVSQLLGTLKPALPADTETVEHTKLVARFTEIAKRDFPESMYLKDQAHGLSINKLLSDTFTDAVQVTSQAGKSIDIRGTKRRLLINLLKTKTNVAVPASQNEGERSIVVPKTAKYDGEWLMFGVDRAFLKTGGFEDLHKAALL